MGTRFYGCLAAENPDNSGETIKMDGLDDSKLTELIDEHPPEGEKTSFFRTLGSVTYNKKLKQESDCENEQQKRAWRRVGVPMLYVEGELADDTDHPNAKAAAELIRFCQRPESRVKVGLSVDGGIAERQNEMGVPDEDGHILSRTVALKAALTTNPCNPKCFLAPMNDLLKSDAEMLPPKRYFEALKKSPSKSSIFENKDVMLYVKLENLKKSISDYAAAFTHMKCEKCGGAIRFFKSSDEIPNSCRKCGNHFSLTNVWRAITR